MNDHVATISARRSNAVMEGDSSSILDTIHRPDAALAVWRRRQEPALLDWLDGLSPDALPHRRFVTPRLAAPDAVAAACAGMPAAPERDLLIEDIVQLIDRFSEIMASPLVRVRLEAIEGDACRRFHQDSVTARLLCTYRGPATEWGRGEPGETPADIRSLDRGDAAIFKGSEWRGAQAPRLLHRSPPIEGTGLARLLLVVDQADPEDDKDWAAFGRTRLH